ncbi:hypothetical protein NC651_001180 [Populus alba x Populus x berolinensis]|nr:hypothetical protein NC651_001180 [Populus alba x Populus x berolinensis]
MGDRYSEKAARRDKEAFIEGNREGGGLYRELSGEVKERGRQVPIPNGEDLNERVRGVKRVQSLHAEVEEAWMVLVLVCCFFESKVWLFYCFGLCI